MTDHSNPVPIAIVERVIDPRLVLFHAPASHEAEQFRGLRNAIFSMNPDRAPRTVLLTAATTGEGLTVTVANLALALSELAGTRVLVVDCNFRKPGVESLLAMSHQVGLAEVLADRLPLHKAIRPTLANNVDVITAGNPPDNPAELLAKGRLKPVLDALKPEYSYILVDSAPASEFTDAHIVARDCDGVVFVVRLETVAKTVVENTMTKLRSLGANLLGAFLVGSSADEKASPIDAVG